eukprot:383583_1
MNNYQLWKINADPVDPDKRVRIKKLFSQKSRRRRISRPATSANLSQTKSNRRSSSLINLNKHHLKTTDTILQRGKRYKPEHYINLKLAKKGESHIQNTPTGFVATIAKESKPTKHFSKHDNLKTTDTILQRKRLTKHQRNRSYHLHRSPKRNKTTIKSLIQQERSRKKQLTSKRNVSQPIFRSIPLEKRYPNHRTRFNIFGF